MYIFFPLCVLDEVTSVITGGFIDQLSLHFSICQGRGGTLQLKYSKWEKKEEEGSTPLLRRQLLWCIFRRTGKGWQTYWKHVKWHSIMGQRGFLPKESTGLKSAQGLLPCKPLEQCPFGASFAVSSSSEDKLAIFFNRAFFSTAAKTSCFKKLKEIWHHSKIYRAEYSTTASLHASCWYVRWNAAEIAEAQQKKDIKVVLHFSALLPQSIHLSTF